MLSQYHDSENDIAVPVPVKNVFAYWISTISRKATACTLLRRIVWLSGKNNHFIIIEIPSRDLYCNVNIIFESFIFIDFCDNIFMLTF